MMLKPMANRTCERGLALIELVVVLVIVLIVAAVAAPTLVSTRRNYRTSGAARDITSEIMLAKMRSASDFTRSRIHADLAGQTFRLELWNKSGSGTWDIEGGTQVLSSGVQMGYGSLSTAPPGTQTTIGQAPACLDNGGTAIANTACILFNSRGIPVDSSGAPTGNYALYITDGSSVYATTISATGLILAWRTDAVAAHWQKR